MSGHRRPPPPPAFPGDLRDGVPPFPFPHSGRHPRPPPHLAAVLDDRIGSQHDEIHALLVDNQRLAATHVALKQELAAVQHEIQIVAHSVSVGRAEKDGRIRQAYEKSMKLESELRAVEAIRAELMQVRGDIQNLNATKEDLSGQVKGLSQELAQASSDAQQGPAIKAEIETMKQEVQRVRMAIDQEKKGYADNYEQGQVMEKKLISMAREVEKLRAEIANAGKSAHIAVAAGNQSGAYGGVYFSSDPSYGSNLYPTGYNTNPVPGGAEASTQYFSGHEHGSWGSYDMQHTHGRR